MALKRIPSIFVPERVESVWLLSAELWKVASVGGLGKVVYNVAKELAKKGIEVKVIMPSHGRHLSDEYRKFLKLREMGLRAEGDRIGVDGRYYHYRLGFEEGELEGFKVILVKGLDYDTGRIIDNWIVYSMIEEKTSLFAKALEIYSLNAIQTNTVPSIIHINDWHTVLAGVKAKQIFEERRIIVPLVFSIHLLNQRSFPWHYASLEWSGIRDEPHYVWFPFRHVLKTYREIWDNYCRGDIEKFGMYESDLIISVSESYMREEILGRLGEWFREKCYVIYNGTDWELRETQEVLGKVFNTIDRRAIRQRILQNLWSIRVNIEDYLTAKILWENRWKTGIRDDYTIEPLSDGQLILYAGRLSYQKGLDILINAFKRVVNVFPDAKLVALGIPTGDYNYLYSIIEAFKEIRNNARLIVGRIDEVIYKALFYSSDVLVVPSRWEPFGIVAIEAMALGTPVIASRVGGLREIITDIREDKEKGNGLLVNVNEEDLSKGILTALSLIKFYETGNQEYLWVSELKGIDREFWEKVRKNAIRTVNEKFRWENIVNELLNAYRVALKIAENKALAWGS